MKRYVIYDDAGVVEAIVTTDFDIVGNKIEVDLGYNADPNRIKVVSGKIVAAAPIVEEEDLDYLKMVLKSKINEDAEKARQKYITSGAGQAMEYLYVAQEARDYLAGMDRHYPLLEAEQFSKPGRSLAELARGVVDAESLWLTVNSEIRRLRFVHIALVEAAGTVDDAKNSAVVNWP